ncbi:CPBP family intramembrane glutamic endopeptidase [Auraticoccus monumenti]|uniref:Membrane protease YdiL, CAAX protease family n=1 Tax=Auraticoccus monumenti TaxID=675864 RepID=A0A1G7BQX1_9ACTN|nr:type II CAAX endopeptidase family protein [Auraticoccus monumenti]SDE29479.1 Membrane protease YdiL, CAAX protease family [Auraticoccus monumenti]
MPDSGTDLHAPPPAEHDTATSRVGEGVPPGVEYHRVLAGDQRRIGRGILAIALLLVGFFAISTAVVMGASWIEAQRGYTTPALGGSDYTPLYHLAAFGSITVLIPLSMLIQRWMYGVRGASLHSVVSRPRFDVLGRSLLVLVPVVLLVVVLHSWLAPAPQAPLAREAALGIFVISLLVVPLQGTAEEYGLRGLVFRIAASWGRGPRTALVLGLLVAASVFMVIHGASDPWLNLWYLVFALSNGIITWRTGGLEVAVVLHGAFNALSFAVAVVLGTDFTITGDREAGATNAAMLVPITVWIVIAAVVWLRTRRSGPARTPQPHTDR